MSIFLLILASNVFILHLIFASISNKYYDGEHVNLISTIEYITRTFAQEQKRTLTFSANAESKIVLSDFGDMIDGILKRIDFATVQIDQDNCEMIGLREFNIFFVDSFKAFERINPANKTRSYDFNEFYLVFLKVENSKEDILKILEYCWKHYIINISIIVEESFEVLNIFTYFPFSKLRCRNTDAILINQFKNGVPKNGNETDDIFPDKLENFQGCPLTAALYNVPPYILILPNQTGLYKFVGFEGHMLRVIAKKLKFSLDYTIPPNNEKRGKIFPNGSTSGAIKLIEEHMADLTIGCFRYSMERASVMTAASPYYQTWEIVTILKTSFEYTPIEILVFPFTPSTWLSLLAFVGIIISFGLLAISYHRVLGPLLLGITANQLVASFLGASMSNLPNGNFIRYMLIMWVIFAFVIRCAYQSLLFKLLQSSLHKKPPETFQELIGSDYTFVLNQVTFEAVNDMLKIQSDQIPYVIKENSLEFIEDNSDGKFAGIVLIDVLAYYIMTNSKRGLFHILYEKVSPHHNTLYFSKHSYLIQKFNGILMNLRSSGLVDLWATQSMDTSYFHGKKRCDGYVKEALKLHQLRGTFDVYLVLVFVASIVFLLELASKRVKVYKIRMLIKRSF